MGIKFANNASTTLAGAITNVATSLSVATGGGALFPALGAGDYFYATLSQSGAVEIVKVTERTGDAMTIVRAQDGTSASAFGAGAILELRPVAAIFNDSSMVVGALGFTPANQATTYTKTEANALLSAKVSTSGDETINGTKTFTGTPILTIEGGAYFYYSSPSNHARMRADGSGNIVFSTGTVGVADRFTLDVSGNLTASGNITAYSDEHLKKDWADVGPNFIEDLAATKHGTYTRIDTGARQVGVSAQAVREFLPEAVIEGDHLSLAYGNAALVACVKLAQRVLELERRLEALEK